MSNVQLTANNPLNPNDLSGKGRAVYHLKKKSRTIFIGAAFSK